MAKPTKAARPLRGAPSKCNEILTALVIRRMEAGEPLNVAASCEGVTAPDLSHWRRHADDGQEPYATFFNDAARARARFISGRLSIVANAEVAVGRESNGSPILTPDPKYALELLRAADPEHYAPQQVLLVKAEENVSAELLSLLRDTLSPSAWAEVVAALRRGDSDDDEAEHVER